MKGKIKPYDRLIDTDPNFERKVSPHHLSANGYIPRLNKDVEIGIKLPKEAGRS
ncbi:hypothetical protein QQ008_14990 [Fulvivirgaceae bacterium BMA10]|uniref:Uncharacterized protein n=1 Tax=Splendidivirga corallicola TaxID=3051826 RepID=A0ABT8KQK2_9BACT|nr:hypothetical protein [Fulvivirgaceae bacterium BMA10]